MFISSKLSELMRKKLFLVRSYSAEKHKKHMINPNHLSKLSKKGYDAEFAKILKVAAEISHNSIPRADFRSPQASYLATFSRMEDPVLAITGFPP
eukprot:snap_masked-scaffold_2-processed-gene-5.38-mRNA-1 protein AED:1.00 eAED:1.00 QI:0/-1/0/0/-1/1/1/0/94